MSWSQHRRLLLFAVLVAVQALFILGIIVREEGRLGGLEIVLESRPVDPRDPLRGDFVILNYAAEDLGHLQAPQVSEGATVHVLFEDRGRFWEPADVSGFGYPPREDWGDDQAWVRARVESSDPLRVSYPNLGNYFIPQGTGAPPRPPEVIVSVSDDGTVRIKRLEIDSNSWPNETVEQSQAALQPAREPPATPSRR